MNNLIALADRLEAEAKTWILGTKNIQLVADIVAALRQQPAPVDSDEVADLTALPRLRKLHDVNEASRKLFDEQITHPDCVYCGVEFQHEPHLDSCVFRGLTEALAALETPDE